MAVRIVTLSENTAQAGLIGEWGLSILVETESSRVLLDTGLTTSAVHNAGILGIDLSTIDTIVLSHGHVDHTGGLRDVLSRVRKQVRVVAHPDVWALKYAVYGELKRYVGIPFRREELEGLGASFSLSQDPVKIGDNIMTTGEIAMTTDYEAIDPKLCVRDGEHMVPDPLADDLALIVRTGQGLALITGCAHRGIVNTVRHAQRITGVERVHTVIGGTHLFVSTPDRIERTAGDLQSLGLEKLGVSHCTGFHPAAALAREFGDVFFLNNAGTQVTLE